MPPNPNVPVPRASDGAPFLILASGSPRRRELLEEAGYRFRVEVPDEGAECGVCSRETPPQTVIRLAFQKAENVAARLGQGRLGQGMILAADTLAEHQGTALGKPAHREHARAMLRRLQGTRHRVYTGVCLWDAATGKRLVRGAETKLEMEALSDETIEDYLDTHLWEGKAGAFGYQDGNDWLRIEEGSPTNVVGLPLELLAEMLESFDRDAVRL
ncbi:MAG TPA: Maf family protein [Pirellulaceae bacterium]|jgi:septum formation protein|nr:Maf family protein [Pirellulaceae bacterium]